MLFHFDTALHGDAFTAATAENKQNLWVTPDAPGAFSVDPGKAWDLTAFHEVYFSVAAKVQPVGSLYIAIDGFPHRTLPQWATIVDVPGSPMLLALDGAGSPGNLATVFSQRTVIGSAFGGDAILDREATRYPMLPPFARFRLSTHPLGEFNGGVDFTGAQLVITAVAF